MRNKRVSYGQPVYWTLGNLHDVLFKILADGAPGDSTIVFSHEDMDEGGIEFRESVLDGEKDVVEIKRYAGFEDKEDKNV